MKSLVTLSLLAFAIAAQAQTTDGAIKATITVLPDGRHKNMIINPETRTAEETIEDKKGKVLSKTVFKLDDRNLPRTATFFDAKGKALYTATYTRDAADHVIEEVYTSPAGKALGRRVYGYGPSNVAGRFKVIRQDDYDAAGNLIVPRRPATNSGRPAKKR